MIGQTCEAANIFLVIRKYGDVVAVYVSIACTYTSLFLQLKKPSHPSRGIPTAINCLATLLKEPLVRSSFVQADGVKFLIPLIIPASSQQSIQVIQIEDK